MTSDPKKITDITGESPSEKLYIIMDHPSRVIA
jgi:hypothetical protein